MMAKRKPTIRGRVAQILNARELVINKGAEHGVREGMKFAILAESPAEIKDPETGEVLDTIDREKVRVQASEVRKRVTICRTYRTRRIPGTIPMLPFLRPERIVIESLEADKSSLPPPLSEEESFVKINDRVVSIAEDEDES